MGASTSNSVERIGSADASVLRWREQVRVQNHSELLKAEKGRSGFGECSGEIQEPIGKENCRRRCFRLRGIICDLGKFRRKFSVFAMAPLWPAACGCAGCRVTWSFRFSLVRMCCYYIAVVVVCCYSQCRKIVSA